MKSVVAIVTNNQTVLMGQVKISASEKFGGLKYVFPGGEIEKGEQATETVTREVKTETGLDLKIIGKIGERVHPRTEKEVEYYHCEAITGHLTTSSIKNKDIDRLIWVKFEELEKYAPMLYDKVAEYLTNLPTK